ncbi:MAG: hypothetical protein OEW15_06630 [Nitrospirota bacterium]|nr:hypothetical protein [Nitrospirota bacterium]
MPRKIPLKLQEVQQAHREKTYKKIEAAVSLLKTEGRIITRSRIAETSGLAASTFCKQHVKEFLLKRFGIGAKEILVSSLRSSIVYDENRFNELLRQNDDLAKRLLRTEQRLDNERQRIKEVIACRDALDHEVKVLRGELDIAKRKIRIIYGKKGLDK